MTTKEIKAKVDTIEKMTQNNEVKAVCDVLVEMLKTIDDKPDIGFKATE